MRIKTPTSNPSQSTLRFGAIFAAMFGLWLTIGCAATEEKGVEEPDQAEVIDAREAALREHGVLWDDVVRHHYRDDAKGWATISYAQSLSAQGHHDEAAELYAALSEREGTAWPMTSDIEWYSESVEIDRGQLEILRRYFPNAQIFRKPEPRSPSPF